MSNKPTDAELDAIDMAAQAIANQNPIGTPFAWRKAYLAAFASAVLAKWGTPQPSDCTRSHPHEDMSDYCLLRTEIARLANENARLKASQPVVREPLTDEQLWVNDEIMSLNADLGWHMDTIRMFTRVIERAHGITQRGGSVTAPAVASEPIAYLYDDGSWTPAKTEEGRKLNDWMISAGSPKIGVHLASTAQPTPLTTLAQATQAGNQQEARPCHVFTVRKAGGLTEWEPTTMALALPDGAHALYTLPQPSPHAHADSVTASMRQGKWTWVPVEPSTAMLVAGNHGRPGDFSALKVWEDMLGALDRSFDYTRPVDPPSTNPPAQAADRMLEDAALLLESQHTWLTNIAAANLVRSLAARARLGEKT